MKKVDLVNKSKYIRRFIRHGVSQLKPRPMYRASLEKLLSGIEEPELSIIEDRVNYYNQLDAPFRLEDPVTMETFHTKGSTEYKLDFKSILRYFDRSLCFQYRFGDTRKVMQIPTLIKVRPLHAETKNAVIMKLDSARHYNFVNDPVPFEKKKDMAIWRGSVCLREQRKEFLEKFFDHPLVDAGDTDKKKQGGPRSKPIIPFSEQLKFKYNISIEGNDVATNAKWIMSSNSLCFMPAPRCETWFMHGRLKPDYHYVQLADDFSDLEEKIEFYNANPDAAREIIRNAHEHVAQFKNRRRELLISLRVVKKYFDLCENNRR